MKRRTTDRHWSVCVVGCACVESNERALRVAYGSTEKGNNKALAPEALFDATKVELVAISADCEVVDLIIVNDSRWTGSDAQVMSLQQKIHTYVGFALDGQMTATYPETDGLEWRIIVDDRAGPVDPTSADIIERVAARVRQFGGDLIVK